MKTKLPFLTLAALGTLLVSLTPTLAQPPPIDPNTGLPMAAGAQPTYRTRVVPVQYPNTGLPMAQPRFFTTAMVTLDPTTGLPITPAEPQWIDPNWNDPDLVLTNLEFNDMPIGEVANRLREQFKNYFDILPMPVTRKSGSTNEWVDWGTAVMVRLQLHHVKASEIFNAMNLVLENDQTPVRWQLRSDLSRPLVQLRVLPQAAPESTPPQQAADKHRMVYFVGDLIGDAKSGGMTMDQIVKTITDLWPSDFGKPDGVIQFHNDAQLLVVNGTPEELEFIHQTLAALHEKVEAAQPKSQDVKDIEDMNKVIKSLKALGNSQ
jgi:hypothetical protein